MTYPLYRGGVGILPNRVVTYMVPYKEDIPAEWKYTPQKIESLADPPSPTNFRKKLGSPFFGKKTPNLCRLDFDMAAKLSDRAVYLR